MKNKKDKFMAIRISAKSKQEFYDALEALNIDTTEGVEMIREFIEKKTRQLKREANKPNITTQ